MLYCLNPACPHPANPPGNVHCQYCGVKIALRSRFRALKPIGKGGFGMTFLAQDLDNRMKPCVVKRLTYQGPDAQSNQKARQLFEQEAERLDQLVHPQIPRLLAYFEEQGYLYLVQEVIEGETLQEELQLQGPFDEYRVKAVLAGLLPVLQFVHSRSVIHRDIKPDNIMRRKSGELILIDFGVAKCLEESGFSKSATTIGTPGYAAPEQLQGRVTPASDLFSLGVTCFQLLTQGFDTGQVPTSGYAWVGTWQTHLPDTIEPNLARVLTRMMAINERDRYPSAAAVLKDLIPTNPPVAGSAPSPVPLIGSESNLKTLEVSPPPNPSTPPLPHSPTPPLSPPPVVPGTPLPPTVPTPVPSSGNATSAPPFSLPATIASNPPGLQPVSVPPSGGAGGPSANGRIKTVPVGFGFGFGYGLVSWTGHAVGFCLAAAVTAALAFSAHPDPQNISASELRSIYEVAMWMHWPLAGFVVGIFQWLVLRRWMSRALWWIPATVASFWIVAVAIVLKLNADVVSLMLGGVIAIPHWLAIRQQAPRGYWWLVWYVVFGFLLLESIQRGPELTAAWIVFVPFLDGWFLAWILRRQRKLESGISPAIQ